MFGISKSSSQNSKEFCRTFHYAVSTFSTGGLCFTTGFDDKVARSTLVHLFLKLSSVVPYFFLPSSSSMQILSNILILLITNGIGLVSRFHLEVKLRNAFREIRECRQKILHVDTRTLEKVIDMIRMF